MELWLKCWPVTSKWVNFSHTITFIFRLIYLEKVENTYPPAIRWIVSLLALALKVDMLFNKKTERNRYVYNYFDCCVYIYIYIYIYIYVCMCVCVCVCVEGESERERDIDRDIYWEREKEKELDHVKQS